jgi:hypothetical protein
LRTDSQEAVLVGGGSVDFAGKKLDLVLKTEHDSTGFFALDVPMVVKGPFKTLRMTPLPGADEHRLDETEGTAAIKALPAALHKLVRGSACAK